LIVVVGLLNLPQAGQSGWMSFTAMASAAVLGLILYVRRKKSATDSTILS
jgi:LPXTG-motif cell wall-anchored protein